IKMEHEVWFRRLDTNAATLSHGVVDKSLVLADHLAAPGDDFAGYGNVRPVFSNELRIAAIADEADLLALWLVRHGQTKGVREATNLWLCEPTQWELDVAELILIQGVEHVALVLAVVDS